MKILLCSELSNRDPNDRHIFVSLSTFFALEKPPQKRRKAFVAEKREPHHG